MSPEYAWFIRAKTRTEQEGKRLKEAIMIFKGVEEVTEAKTDNASRSKGNTDENPIIGDEAEVSKHETVFESWKELPLTDRIGSFLKMQQDLLTDPDLVSVPETMQLKGLSSERVRQVFAEGFIPAIQVKKEWLGLREAINKWIPPGRGRPTQK